MFYYFLSQKCFTGHSQIVPQKLNCEQLGEALTQHSLRRLNKAGNKTLTYICCINFENRYDFVVPTPTLLLKF